MKPKSVSYLYEVAVYGLVSLFVWQPVWVYAEVAADALPVASANWVSKGEATRSDAAGRMDINVSDRVSLNWDSFNIGKDATVNFQQPDSGSIALNRVNGGGTAASQIMGKLNANGVIYILDRNGVIFGPDSQVNVASLIASTLDINAEFYEKFEDANSSIADAIKESKAAFTAFADDGKNNQRDPKILMQGGASIQTTDGGQVFLFAPSVTTEKGSKISTPDGQAVMAATTDSVFLAASTDPDLRGMLVEVGKGGDISHAGEIVAERGNITLAALAINQNGTLTATTSVDANGTIRLLARDGGRAERSSLAVLNDETDLSDRLQIGVLGADGELNNAMRSAGSNNQVYLPTAENTAARSEHQTVGVVFGADSITQILPDQKRTSDNKVKTKTDADAQPPSYVEVMGKTIDVLGGANVVVTGGTVSMVATTTPADPMAKSALDSGARITVHDGALIDVSGADTAVVAMERNSLEVQLRGSELADSPLQRNDPDIRGKTAYIDLRYGESIALADISGYVASIGRSADERLSAGGKVNLYSEGVVDFQKGANVDISGGAVNFNAGFVKESRVISNGVSYNIGEASADRDYDALLNPGEYYNERWNLVQKYVTQDGREQKGVWVNGYTQGKSAGEFQINSRSYHYDGNVAANVVVGPYQRSAPSSVGGGKITLDTTRITNASQAVLLTSEDKFRKELAQNGPRNPAASQTLISVDRFKNSADSITIKSSAGLTLDNDATLTLDGGGSLTLQGVDVTINSDITNHAGNVSLAAKTFNSGVLLPQLVVADGVVINTSGNWVNDATRASADPYHPVRINAGNISLNSEGSLYLGDNALLNANGGAWLNHKGKLKGGAGGNVTIMPGDFRSVTPSVMINGNATSYSLTQGGKFTLGAAGFHIGDVADADDATDRIQLSPDWFQQGGFSAFELSAMKSGIDVAENTHVMLQGNRYQMADSNYLTAATGAAPDSLFTVVAANDLPDYVKPTVALSLKSSQSGLPGAESRDGIRMGTDSLIQTLPGGNVNLYSDGGDIAIDGAVIARGGNIALHVTPKSDISAFDPSLAIRLGESSVLDVSATVVDKPTVDGLIQRDVYAAGSVKLNVDSGYLLGEQGSRIVADGLSTSVSQYDSLAKNSTVVPVDLNAGSIYLRASDGIVMDTALSAKKAGKGRSGSLTVAFDTQNRLPLGVSENLTGFIDYPLQLKVGDYAGLMTASVLNSRNIRQSITDAGLENGVAYIDVNRVNQGDFASIKLSTINQPGKKPTDITFETNTALTANESIQLTTPSIRVNANDAQIVAPYIALGTDYSDADKIRTGNLLAPTGTFTAQADFIDLKGGVTFRDASKVTLDSATDIRLRGAVASDGDREAPTGIFNAVGDVDLFAGQVYAATFSDYVFNLSAAQSTLTISNKAGESDPLRKASPVLSAGGSIHLKADNIVQQGVLKSPFGTINLDARSTLTLRDGSVTSVSGEGQTVLMGTVDGVGAWQYALNSAEPLIVEAPVEKSVILTSPVIDHQEGATVDVSGGGDLLAYYFVKGPNGSRDVLAYGGENGGAGESFAIIPTYAGRWAPYDTIEVRDFPYVIGDTVRFENALGLDPTIEYAILPARYALLPGALLVTPINSTYVPGSNKSDLKGAAVVAGQFSNAAGTEPGAQWNNFVIEPGLTALERSELRVFSANQYFDSNRPVDAGRIVYDASNAAVARLNIDGNIIARAGESGNGGRLDINAANIIVTNGGDENSNAVLLNPEQLESLNVDSILLGGVRSADADGNRITVGANTVEIKQEAKLAVTELLLAAKDTVTVRAGASIQATRDGKTRDGVVNVTGNSGALLQVSSGNVIEVVRPSSLTTTRGSLIIEEGASIYGAGAVVLDSTQNTQLDGDINTAGTLAINANKILLGGDANIGNGISLSGDILNHLAARDLRLLGRESVDVIGDINLDLKRMILDTQLLKAVGEEPVTASINIEDTFTFRNSSGNVNPAAVPSGTGGTLAINANKIYLEGAANDTTALTVQGFDAVSLTGSQQIAASGRVGLAMNGNADVMTNKLTSTAGSDLLVSSTGNLQLRSASEVATGVSDANEGFASRYVLTGQNVDIDTSILAASGAIEVNARQDVHLGDKANLNVAGAVFDFADAKVVTDGGKILLNALNGNIVSSENTVIDVSALDVDANSGALSLSALNGTIELNSAPIVSRFEQPTGGSVSVEVASVESLQTLLPSLRGFNHSQRIYTRSGNLDVGSTNQIKADNIELITDNGSIRIDGTLDSSAEQGGNIGLYASDTVSVGGTGRLLANATGTNQRGGNILLAAETGSVDVENGSYFNLSGTGSGEGGTLSIDAARTDSDINFTDGGARVEGVDKLKLRGVRRYSVGAGQTLDQAFVDGAAKSETATFMENMAAALNTGGNRFSSLIAQLGERFEISPLVEFYSNDNLVVSGAIDLSSDINPVSAASSDFGGQSELETGGWRYRNNDQIVAGTLRLRADKSIILEQSVSDGFVRSDLYGGFAYPQETPIAYQSWQFEFAAGSNAKNAKALSATTSGVGDLHLLNGSLIRTGTGDINVSTGGDLVLSNGASLYTGGYSPYVGWQQYPEFTSPESGILDPQDDMWAIFSSTNIGTARIFYPVDGGDVTINAGGNVVSQGDSVPHTDWLFRVADTGSGRFTWGVLYENFVNGIGALSGGDITVNVKGDIENMTFAVPTTAMQINQYQQQKDVSALLDIRGGGDINITAGGDILAGNYLVSRGTLAVQSGGRIGKLNGAGEHALASLIALGEGSVFMSARNDIELSGVVDQNLIPISTKQTTALSGTEDQRTQFLTNTTADTVALTSLAGDIIVNPDGTAHKSSLGGIGSVLDSYSALPARVNATALQGGIRFMGDVGIESHPDSGLTLLASKDIAGATGVSVVMGGYSDYLNYRMGEPLNGEDYAADNLGGLRNLLGTYQIKDAVSRQLVLQSNANIFAEGAAPIKIVSLHGNMAPIDKGNGAFSIELPRTSFISIAGNIEDTKLYLQNNFSNDISYLYAGGDITATTYRTDKGGIGVVGSKNAPTVGIQGPGTLLMEVGGDIDLGASGGIVSWGDKFNTALPDAGADVIAIAGLKSTPDFSGFASTFMTDSISIDAASSFIAATLTGMSLSVKEINDILNTDYKASAGSVDQANHPSHLSVVLSSSDTRNLTPAQSLFIGLSPQQQLIVANTMYQQSDVLHQKVLVYKTLQNEVTRAGYEDANGKDGDNLAAQGKGFARGFNAINTLFDPAQAWEGDIALVSSTVSSQDGGDISLLTPGGGIDIGLPDAIPGINKTASELGIIGTRTGDVQILAEGDVLVNQSRIFALDGDVSIWSSSGDIDAGRGSKTARGDNNAQVFWDAPNHRFVMDFGAVVSGSGIRAKSSDPDGSFVSLSAPQGVIDAGDAGIGAANLILAADVIKGADNLDIDGGVSIGVPTSSGVSATVASAGNSVSGSSSGAMDDMASAAESASESANQVAFLTVEIIGLGE